MNRDIQQMTQWVNELRSPLGNLMGQLELRQEEMDSGCFNQLWEDCQELREQLEQLLRLIRIGTEQALPYWEHVCVREHIEQALLRTQNIARKRGVFLQNEYMQEDCILWSDGAILQEIIEQLLKYALRYCENGSILTLGYTARGGWASIWAEGTGREYRFLSMKNLLNVSSIGMEICRCLADRIGAELFWCDAPRGGSRIGVRLPTIN